VRLLLLRVAGRTLKRPAFRSCFCAGPLLLLVLVLLLV
jgi:hypothetical protein